MVPHAELPHTGPTRCQVTPVIVVPATKATNCCCCPTRTVELAGDTVTVTSEDDPMMTAALTAAERSAREVAVTVTTLDFGATAGAR